jgi:hypothetical protein
MGKKILLAVTIAAAVSGSAFAAEQGREKSNSKALLLMRLAALHQTALIKKSISVK